MWDRKNPQKKMKSSRPNVKDEKKNIKKYSDKEENPSQLGVTWQTNNPWYEIEIKKEYQKDDLVKKTNVQ